MTTTALHPPALRRRSITVAPGVGATAILALAAGALLSAGYALHPLWWAPWLAPVPLMAAAARSPRAARLAGGIAGAVAVGSVLSYYVEMTGWGGTLLLTLLRVGSWMLAAGLAGAAARRLPLAAAALVLPCTMAAIELLTHAVSPHGAAGSLAYSQMAVPRVVQAAALGGVPAVVFLLLLPGSLAGLWLSRSQPRAERRAACALVGSIGLAAALFSIARLGAPPAGNTIPVTLIATNRFDGMPRDWAGVWAAYRPAVMKSSARGGLVVLPEKLVLVDSAGAALAARDVAAAARATGASVVVGLEVRERGGYYNRALLAQPDGRVAWYDKQRLVPGWEDRITPGTAPAFVDVAGTPVGMAICKDMHVPGIGRQYGGAAAIVVVPAYDFGRDGWMGARMTAMRAVENGYAVARSARHGFVGAYDRTGRLVAEQRVGDGVTVAQASLSAAGADTPYSRMGDAFGWLCVGCMVLLRIWLARQERVRPIS